MKSIPVLLTLAILAGFAIAADPPAIDFTRLRQLHEKVRSGEKLTPEEQAYYERGKAVRKRVDSKRKRETPPASNTANTKTSTGLVPLVDRLASDTYKGEDGGLYGKGRNTPPEAHLKVALTEAAKIKPLDADGKPAADGKIVLLTQGMSNTTGESQEFIKVAKINAAKNSAVVIVDGAQGGVDSRNWVAANDRGKGRWNIMNDRLKTAGVTPKQVQVVWMKHAIGRVAQFGEFPKHAQQLKDDMAEICRMLKTNYPNLKLVYVSSRSFAGYATTELNPEPYAYECAYAVRWLIQDQINGVESLSHSAGKAPLLLWGPYLWSDGEKGRKADDLVYKREDYREDGTHPSDAGRAKIADRLLKFFSTDPTAAPWFLKPKAEKP